MEAKINFYSIVIIFWIFLFAPIAVVQMPNMFENTQAQQQPRGNLQGNSAADRISEIEYRSIADRIPDNQQVIGIADRIPDNQQVIGIADRIPDNQQVIGIADRISEVEHRSIADRVPQGINQDRIPDGNPRSSLERYTQYNEEDIVRFR
jgi:hypothetical protein